MKLFIVANEDDYSCLIEAESIEDAIKIFDKDEDYEYKFEESDDFSYQVNDSDLGVQYTISDISGLKVLR